MTAHLLALSIGPVQEFIAAARRTRDLWFGSYVLSEISKAAARAMHDAGAKLIFPAPDAVAALESGSDLNVANVVLAELPAGLLANDVTASAKDAAQERWGKFATGVYAEFQGAIHADLWRDQISDVIEIYGAWVPLDEATYKEQRKRLMRLLAGRKNCRDFQPARGREGVPKSSLDGLRESVLKASEQWPSHARRRLRVRRGEELDAVGLTKRAAEGHRPYPSVSRVAADPWLRGLAAKTGEETLTAMIGACDELQVDGLLHKLNVRAFPQYRPFPFEGSVVYRTRHHELLEETDESPQRLTRLKEELRILEEAAKDAGLGAEPSPYLALLVADGDRMGDVISRLESPDQHRVFSRQLSTFAGNASQIVAKHNGVLVYSGGDDVLAFLPVDTSLACARELHDEFGRLMEQLLRSLKMQDSVEPMTISIGLAIAHFLENLEDLLAYGRGAEKAAKEPDRDGLAVHVRKRGGGPVAIRRSWKTDPDRRLAEFAQLLLAGAIPNRIGYDLEQVARVYEDWHAATVNEAIRLDALRVIARKQPRGESQMDRIARLVSTSVSNAKTLRELCEELAIARQIAVAFKQSGASAPASPAEVRR